MITKTYNFIYLNPYFCVLILVQLIEICLSIPSYIILFILSSSTKTIIFGSIIHFILQLLSLVIYIELSIENYNRYIFLCSYFENTKKYNKNNLKYLFKTFCRIRQLKLASNHYKFNIEFENHYNEILLERKGLDKIYCSIPYHSIYYITIFTTYYIIKGFHLLIMISIFCEYYNK